MNKSALRKELFPVTDHLTYFNHAAVGPLSAPACEAMVAHAREQRDFGALHWREWYAAQADLRRTAARLINADSSEIAIVKNTSEGISFVAEGIRWNDGDNVITTDMEFPSNYIPWKRLERRGVECRLVQNVDGAFTPEMVGALIDDRTRVVSISSVSFHNGFTPDLEAIGRICADAGVFFCVDAIQSLGALPMDVRAAKVSFLAADGHKWMLGPEGTGIFFAADAARDSLEVFESGWMNIARSSKFIGAPTDLHPDGRRFEAGTLNTNGVSGLDASLSLLCEIGIDKIAEELRHIAGYLASSLEGIGYRVHSPRPIASGIVGATPPVVDMDRLRQASGTTASISDPVPLLHAFLERERVICAPREGMLRFSPHFYNDEHEVDRVVELLKSMNA